MKAKIGTTSSYHGGGEIKYNGCVTNKQFFLVVKKKYDTKELARAAARRVAKRLNIEVEE